MRILTKEELKNSAGIYINQKLFLSPDIDKALEYHK